MQISLLIISWTGKADVFILENDVFYIKLLHVTTWMSGPFCRNAAEKRGGDLKTFQETTTLSADGLYSWNITATLIKIYGLLRLSFTLVPHLDRSYLPYFKTLFSGQDKQAKSTGIIKPSKIRLPLASLISGADPA